MARRGLEDGTYPLGNCAAAEILALERAGTSLARLVAPDPQLQFRFAVEAGGVRFRRITFGIRDDMRVRVDFLIGWPVRRAEPGESWWGRERSLRHDAG